MHLNLYFLILFSSLFLQFAAGTVYLFGSYAGDLKATLGMTQSQVQLLGTLLNIGSWASFLGGLVLDRFGGKIVCLVGAILMFLGYFILYLAAAQIAAQTINFYALWAIFALIAGQGGSFFVILALKYQLQNFPPTDRGVVVGALQAAFGVAAGVFSLLQYTFFKNDVAKLLLFISLFGSLSGLAFGLLINITRGVAWATEQVERHLKRRITAVYILFIGVAVFILIVAILKQVFKFSDAALIGCSITAIVMIASILVIVPVGIWPWVERSNPLEVPVEKTEHNGEESKEQTSLIAKESSSSSSSSDLDSFQMLKTVDFYLIFIPFTFCVGTTIAVINNVHSIIMARSLIDYPSSSISEKDLPNLALVGTFVAVFSSCNTLGRMGFGFLSDRVKDRVPRSLFLVISSILMLLAQIGMCFFPLFGYYALIVVLGAAYGGVFGLIPTICADTFGEKHFGANYGVLAFAPALGSLLCSTVTAGMMADRFVAEGNITVVGSDGDTSIQCVGVQCYLYTSITFVILMCFATAAAVALYWRTRRTYVKISDGKSGVFFLAGGVRVFLRNQKWGKWGFGGLIPHLRCILTKLGCFESRKNITRTTTTIPNRKQKNLSSTDLDFHLSSDFI